ncbi:phosphatase PAP2 family protein [Candidatus Riesia pediculischaeffi]|nr:phosphatase PAP2 family protein [Candidatus Riesia pediculischaeffi]
MTPILIFFAEKLIFLFPIFMWMIYMLERKNDISIYIFLFKIILSLFFSFFISFLLSRIFYKDRPFVVGIKSNILCHKLNSSFPSMHGSISFTISLSYLIWTNSRFRVLMLFPSFIICWARVFLGVHWTSDMISSFIISLISCMIAGYIWKNYHNLLTNFFKKKINLSRK